MSRKYLIWKDPACQGKNIEWLEVTGKDFLSMVRSPEGKTRRFIKLNADPEVGDDTIIIEATQEQYVEWRKEHRATVYRASAAKDKTVLSLDHSTGGADVDTMHETVADPEVDVEREALSLILQEQLADAIRLLSDEEAGLLSAHYVKGKSTVELAREMGISQQAVSKRISKVLSKLQKNF